MEKGEDKGIDRISIRIITRIRFGYRLQIGIRILVGALVEIMFTLT